MTGVRIAVLHPLLGQPIGDEGNALVVSHRARRRGIAAEVVEVHHRGALPNAHIYLLGGLPTRDQVDLAELLRAGDMERRLAEGAALLAVNAGFEVLGEWFEDVRGERHAGVGLLGLRVRRVAETTGPVVTHPGGPLDLPAMSGFEARSGLVALDPDIAPLATINPGRRPGTDPRHDGAVTGRVIGTYLHGPVLARNPELADRILEWAVGAPLAPLEPGVETVLRSRRIREDLEDPTGWGGRKYGPPSLSSLISRRRRQR